MGLGSLVGPAVVAAVVSGLIAIVGFIINGRTSRDLHRQRLEADFALTEKKTNADIELTRLKFKLDRNIASWKWKAEFAEEILSDFYRARDLFKSARRPFAFGGEGASRPVREGSRETPDVAQSKNAAYAPVERLNRDLEFLNALSAKRYRFGAVFGESADQEFGAFVGSYNEVLNAAWAMIDELGLERDEQSEMDPDSRKRIRQALGWGRDSEDEIAPRLDAAVTKIEAIVRPFLQDDPLEGRG